MNAPSAVECHARRLSIFVLKGQAAAAIWVIFGMGLNSRPIKPAGV